MDIKTLYGAASVILLLVAYGPYIHSILNGTVKPHLFTWVIWVVLSAIAFAVQLYEKAGPGSWLMGVTCLLCATVMILSFRQSDKDITKSDWLCFVTALSAIPLWYVTKEPTASVVLISLIDGVGFLPTYRKAWNKPYEDSAVFFMLGSITVLLSILALEDRTLNAALYPFSVFIFNSTFAILLVVRRRILASSQKGLSP